MTYSQDDLEQELLARDLRKQTRSSPGHTRLQPKTKTSAPTEHHPARSAVQHVVRLRVQQQAPSFPASVPALAQSQEVSTV
jgi:hypothetical protein